MRRITKPVPSFRTLILDGMRLPPVCSDASKPSADLPVKLQIAFARRSMGRLSATRRSAEFDDAAAAPLPAAEELHRFASYCRSIADEETDGGKRALFRQMESAWTRLAAQIERTDELIRKMRAIRCRSMN